MRIIMLFPVFNYVATTNPNAFSCYYLNYKPVQIPTLKISTERLKCCNFINVCNVLEHKICCVCK
jgi:hypothetical protein